VSRPREPTDGHTTVRRALALGAAAAVCYTVAVFGDSLLPGSNVSVSGTLWHAVGLYGVFAFGTVGVLWLRHETWTPGALLALVLVFWHVLVYVPPIGSGAGDAPGVLFVFVGAPAYLVAYGELAGGELWLRGRRRGGSGAG
jgi:hypothetical protein